MKSPAQFLLDGPESADELIGKSAAVARVLTGRVESGDVLPVRVLLHGDQGIGKSAIARLVSKAIAPHSSNIRHMSAGQVTPEIVRDWMMELRFRGNDWKAWWIEECDAVSPAVEVLMLQFLDLMPEKTAMICTSNASLGALTPRFQSRFHAIKVAAPSTAEVRDLLLRWKCPRKVAQEIADGTKGDVRAALNDLQFYFDTEKYNTKEKQ